MRQDALETVPNGTGTARLPRAGYQQGGSSGRAGGTIPEHRIDGGKASEHAGCRDGPAPSSPRGPEWSRAPVRQYMPSFFGARQSPAIGNIVTAAYSLYLFTFYYPMHLLELYNLLGELLSGSHG